MAAIGPSGCSVALLHGALCAQKGQARLEQLFVAVQTLRQLVLLPEHLDDVPQVVAHPDAVVAIICLVVEFPAIFSLQRCFQKLVVGILIPCNTSHTTTQ